MITIAFVMFNDPSIILGVLASIVVGILIAVAIAHCLFFFEDLNE